MTNKASLGPPEIELRSSVSCGHGWWVSPVTILELTIHLLKYLFYWKVCERIESTLRYLTNKIPFKILIRILWDSFRLHSYLTAEKTQFEGRWCRMLKSPESPSRSAVELVVYIRPSDVLMPVPEFLLAYNPVTSKKQAGNSKGRFLNSRGIKIYETF